ncbi:F420-dependent oxidoreductase-like protein [Pseudonocardia hierapolitana]|uniref:F420-dependent oxidoreductase-like protein n=1 Tax=Pseudonocardia hierapolitana TaxID=1128676 RepID=A0A561T2Z3_9PSEU|nr:TIGR03564 family F420-dependent LLM class oxidoreductase [Pseudonocardia hierapolitana]TWF81478.1 F420-dependent oxidoreductase-like protein [Pseudonocardia hierapolitana]
MQIGMWIDDEKPLPAVVDAVVDAERRGFARAWFGQRLGWDPLTMIAAIGDRAPRIGLGTAVVVTWSRHPLTLAAEALTVQAAVQGRFTLGIGPSHQPIVEGRFGYRWQRPGQHVEEYADVLSPALRGDAVDVRGETVTAAGRLTVPATPPPPLLIAAHGPRLLRLAGERADGVITTWTDARSVAENVVPAVLTAAAGRPDSQIVVGLIATLTDDPDAARAHVAQGFGMAGDLPSYRRSLDQAGLAGPEDTILAGNEAELEKAVRRFADAGATELQVCPLGPPAEQERTIEFFGELARSLRA